MTTLSFGKLEEQFKSSDLEPPPFDYDLLTESESRG